MAAFERRPKSCLPTSGSTLRSSPTIAPTSAFRPTSSANWRGVLPQPEPDRRSCGRRRLAARGWPRRSAPAQPAAAACLRPARRRRRPGRRSASIGLWARSKPIDEIGLPDRPRPQTEPRVVARQSDDVVGQLEQPPQATRAAAVPGRAASPATCRSGRPTSPISSESPVNTSHGSSRRRDADRRPRRRGGRAHGRVSRSPSRACSRARPRSRRASATCVERDAGAGGQIRRRAGALDEPGETRHMVGLHVRLEHSHDRRSDRSAAAT